MGGYHAKKQKNQYLYFSWYIDYLYNIIWAGSIGMGINELKCYSCSLIHAKKTKHFT